MSQTYANTRNCAMLAVVLITAIAAVGANSNPVLADPCSAQLGYPVMGAQPYYYSNVQVTVSVSATCSFYTNQLYVVGTAYDTTYNSNVGTANTVLSAVYGGNSFNGQLQFSLPSSTQTHSVQFSVSIYNGQTGYSQPYGYYQPYYGNSPLTTTSETFVVTPSNYLNNYPYYTTYQNYPGYYYVYNPHPTYNRNPINNYHYYNNNYYSSNNQYYHNGGNNYYHPSCSVSNNYCRHR